jgi:hypothetical protein
MKFKKPSGEQVMGAASLAGGTLVGFKASKGVESVIPAKFKTPGKVAIAVAGLVLAVGVTGTSTGSKAVRGAGIGMALDQANKAINSVTAGKLPSHPVVDAMFSNSQTSVKALTPEARVALNARLGRGMGNGIQPDMYRMANPVGGTFIPQ